MEADQDSVLCPRAAGLRAGDLGWNDQISQGFTGTGNDTKVQRKETIFMLVAGDSEVHQWVSTPWSLHLPVGPAVPLGLLYLRKISAHVHHKVGVSDHGSIVHHNQKLDITQEPITSRMNKMFWYNHTRECYTALKTNREVLFLAATWVYIPGVMRERGRDAGSPSGCTRTRQLWQALGCVLRCLDSLGPVVWAGSPAGLLILELPTTF